MKYDGPGLDVSCFFLPDLVIRDFYSDRQQRRLSRLKEKVPSERAYIRRVQSRPLRRDIHYLDRILSFEHEVERSITPLNTQ